VSAKKGADARIVSAKVVVYINIRQLVEEQLYLKLPDAADIVIENVDWDETYDWLDNNHGWMPVAVAVVVSE
jgi:hypothetical protein